jgi:hypothetical protein
VTSAGRQICPACLTHNSDFRISLPDFAPQISATLAAGPVTLTFTQPGGHLVLDAPPWVSALSLLPAGSGAAQQAAALSLIPRLALSSAVSAVIESLVGPALRIGPIDALLAGDAVAAGRIAEARAAYDKAISLTTDAAVRAQVQRRADSLQRGDASGRLRCLPSAQARATGTGLELTNCQPLDEGGRPLAGPGICQHGGYASGHF